MLNTEMHEGNHIMICKAAAGVVSSAEFIEILFPKFILLFVGENVMVQVWTQSTMAIPVSRILLYLTVIAVFSEDLL